MRFISLLISLSLALGATSQNYYMFVGTYTSGKSEGIYVYRFNTSTGAASLLSTVKSQNPSYLAISPTGKYVYAVNEGGPTGEVSSFLFDKGTGQLHLINKQSSGGADPCYISEDKTSKWVVVANYSGGSLAALPVNADGSLEPITQLIRHTGTGVDKQRQEKAHVHSTVFSPDQHFLFAADLGIDKESVYHFSPEKKQPLSGANDSMVAVDPGTGPRHFVFHPSKPYAYVVGELSGTVDAFTYTSTTGELKHLQRVSTVPPSYKGSAGSADIHITPNGKFLYASNRAEANSIAMYSIDATGKLHLKGFQSTLGTHPRNFIIDPTGHFLLVANRDTDNIVIFSINPQTGVLRGIGKQINVPNPVCLKMLR